MVRAVTAEALGLSWAGLGDADELLWLPLGDIDDIEELTTEADTH